MDKIAENVILSGRFELASMLAKLDTLWMKGSLTDAQRTGLMALAREHADPALSVDLLTRLEDHEDRLRKLEAGSTSPEDWPEWSVHRVYCQGDRITFEGQRYVCCLPEQVPSTTWSPRDYPAYWKKAE